MFAVAVTFKIHKEHWDRFMPLMLLNARSSVREEPGCQQFDVCSDPSRAHEVFLYEVYDDEAAFKEHMTTPHYIKFQDAIEGMIASKDVQSFARVAR